MTVAADFQKNPQCFMSHPGVGLDKWEDLPKANPAFVSAGAINTFWAWMRVAYGFKDDNIKPYNFNSAPFIVDKHSIQQGYATSEPFEVERQGMFKPNVFLLADYGYDTYATQIMTRREIVEKNPDSCSASSAPRRSAGITTFTATMPRRTPRSRRKIRS